jgi:glycosyltransferase involved in cell wall biosynthesis
VTVTGELPRLEECYLEAAVFVAPLFVGGGLKFKVPQAMLHGLPVIATTVAAEGVVEEAPDGTFWAVTDDPRAMAHAVVSALQRPGAAAELGGRAAAWVRSRYGFRASTEQLLATYAELIP